MAPLRQFQIRYRLQQRHKSFVQPDSRMDDSDAWYYACLHAGIAKLHNIPALREDLPALIRYAERAGLSGVTWEEITSGDSA